MVVLRSVIAARETVRAEPDEQIALCRVRTMHANGDGASLRQIGAWLRPRDLLPQGGARMGTVVCSGAFTLKYEA